MPRFGLGPELGIGRLERIAARAKLGEPSPRVADGEDRQADEANEPADEHRLQSDTGISELRLPLRWLAILRTLPRPPPLLTVNAAPRAVPAYVRLGFRATGPERMVDGIRAVPMIITVRRTKARARDGGPAGAVD